MDIKRASSTKHRRIKPALALLATVSVAALSGWQWSQPSAAEKIATSEIWSEPVIRGDLSLQVSGYGKLKSRIQRLLTAPANATVDEIMLKPGALITAGSTIVRLTNPEIEQQVKDAIRALDNRMTHLRQLQLNQKREILAHQAALETLRAELEIAELKVEAEQQLVSKGIVSELDFKRSSLEQRQLTRRLAIEEQRLRQLAEIHTDAVAIAEEKIQQQQEQVAVIRERFDKLTVRAGIDGVVQDLPVALGQSVAFGEQVALVGSVNDLYAMLNVSQTDIEQIKLAQPVRIDTRGGTIGGQITRISPLVEQGTVAVEVALIGPLPANARPELSIDGIIDTGLLTNVLYLAKPVNAAPGTQARLFRLAQDKRSAERVVVRYGQETTQFIEILAGATPGDSFILSDMTRWQDKSTITITH